MVLSARGTMTAMANSTEEFGIFVDRFFNFRNIWTIYSDLLAAKYIPSTGDTMASGQSDWPNSGAWPVDITVMFILYAYFYSLVEDSDDAINGFRLWRDRHPEERVAIEAVEAQVAPFLDNLRLFRNRLAFHGSQSREHESKGLDVFNKHSGGQIFDAMKNFKALGAALFAKENAGLGIGPVNAEQANEWIIRVAQRAREQTGQG
jgi:hypothetical protein